MTVRPAKETPSRAGTNPPNASRVPEINKWDESRPRLEMLHQTIVDDIAPLLSTVGGAPHAIAREVFSYVDHLGHLFTGQSDNVGERFKCYVRHVLGLVDPNYARRADELYEMYRNGLIHEFDPKVLANKSGESLAWLSYPGARREPKLQLEPGAFDVTHLTPLRLDETGKNYHLPVSTVCLITDLLSSITMFIDGVVGTEETRVRAWNKAAKALNKPGRFDFAL
jgi:hypothetical protein